MAKGAYIGVNGVARKVKKGYLGVLSRKYTLKNIAPTINGATGFNAGSASTTHTKYASKSLMLTGTTSTAEVTATTTSSYPLVKGHKYYARVEIYQETVVGSSDFYWPIAEPSFYNGKVATAGRWTIISKTSTRSDWSSGNYQLRLDFNNVNNAGYMWFDGLMLIDLTEAFGAGNEPTATWLNKNVPFFKGTMEVEKKTSSGVAREFKSGYVGVSGVARQFFKGGLSLGDIAVGSIVYINENGSPVAFYVAKHDYESALNGTGRTLLVRKGKYPSTQVWSSGVNSYASSSLNSFVNGTYKGLFDSTVQSLIGTTTFYYTVGNGSSTKSTLSRSIFVLSLTEFGKSASGANVEGSALPIANILQSTTEYEWTRTPRIQNSYDTSTAFRTDGAANSCTYTRDVRPCFTLPATALFDPTTMQFLSA